MDLNSLLGALHQGASSTTPSQSQLNVSAKPVVDMPQVAAALSELAATAEVSSLSNSNSANAPDAATALAASSAQTTAQLSQIAAQLGGAGSAAGSGSAGEWPAAGALQPSQIPQALFPGAQLTGQAGQVLPSGAQLTGQPGQVLPSGAQLTGQPGQVLPSGTQLTGQAGQAARMSPQSQLPPTLAKLPVPTGTPGVIYNSGAPASANLLSQGGVSAYIQLLNVLTSNQQDTASANQLTNSLTNASSALKIAYSDAISKLSPQLQQKDWSFSLSNGVLVFEEGDNRLSTQDLTDLQRAFSSSNAQFSAKQLADALMSIQQLRRTGADSGSLAWGGIEVDENNFSQVVDLRDFVTGSAPGGNYSPHAASASDLAQLPPMLGGLDLRDMVTMRPNFLRPNGSVRPDAIDVFDDPEETPEIATLHGRCSCGEVSFIVEDTFEYAYYCHCSRCRIRTGSAFAAIAGIGIEKVQVTAGHEHMLIEGECSDGYGARCKRCHSFLFATVRDRQYIHVSLGVLAESPSRTPDHHIYVASKAGWYHITDGLPQFDEAP